jgi:hypothetical protein
MDGSRSLPAPVCLAASGGRMFADTSARGVVDVANRWFESVAVAQRRAQRVLPRSVYKALIAGSERGTTVDDNTAAFAELRFSPVVVGQPAQREMATSVMASRSRCRC